MDIVEQVNPNQFEGTDIQRIQCAIEEARGTTNKVFIPSKNSNGTNVWLLDSAILLPGNITVILDNCTLQLSDKCRDNMFRSNNVGIGITDPIWNRSISIIGIGDVYLKGANNPRATNNIPLPKPCLDNCRFSECLARKNNTCPATSLQSIIAAISE